MENPFPGMNPYLEQYWREIHQRLITYAGDVLQSHLPESLRARIEERVFLETEDVRYRHAYPDIHIVEHPRPSSSASATQVAQSDVAVVEPLIMEVENEPVTERYIEIVDAASGNRVVTVIEFLSPANKVPGNGQKLYLRKQRDVIDADINLVEVDLTRSGERVLSLHPINYPPAYRTTYQILVRRAARPFTVEIYPAPLSRRLPAIHIPLRPDDKDIDLDLQGLIDRCYKNGRYDDIDYASDPEPPLGKDDAIWADQRLKEKGIR